MTPMKPDIIQNKATVFVLGLGRSGVAAARLAKRRGGHVIAYDDNDSPALRETAAALAREGIEVILGRSPKADGGELAVISPGINPATPRVRALTAGGCRLISELELGWAYLPGRVLAITGSSGKSTLAKFCAETLQQSGVRTALGGNYGLPVSELALQDEPPEWSVLEVSSFQLETTDRFRPDVAIWFNLHPNHLDRHESMDAYAAAKAHIFSAMTATDTPIVLDSLLPQARRYCPGIAGWQTFGLTPDAHWRFREGKVFHSSWAADGITFCGTLFDNAIMGLTAAATCAAVTACGIDARAASPLARVFKRLPHRMETVAVIDGVIYIDDSKATTLAALAAGIEMAPGRVHVIAGGRLKEKDLNSVKKVLAKKTEALYVIGESAPLLEAAWSDVAVCWRCGELEIAVKRAAGCARPGEVVLLSPGCASFDQFRGYDDRGGQFQDLVKSLERRGM